MRQLRRVPPLFWDLLLGLVFVAVGQVELHVTSDDGYRAGSALLNTPLELMLTLPLVLWRRAPRATLLAMLAVVVVPSLFVRHTLFFWGGILPIALVNYAVARHCVGRFARLSWLACVGGVGAYLLLSGRQELISNLLFAVVIFGATWVAGRVLRRLTIQGDALAVALSELAEEQAMREEEAVHAERGRIAVEMHDVVAHAVSLMVVQVGAARMELERAGAVQHRLRDAEDTGRQALGELRRTLGVLRAAPDGTLQPLPDLSATPELVRRFQNAGLQVTYNSTLPEDLPASLQLATYRIVQEALTNALKHAGQVPVQAVLCADGDQIVVQVDSARGTAGLVAAGGHGLNGMRERVAMFGGQLQAGQTADGFSVRAVLQVPT